MTLGEAQRLFPPLVAKLITHAAETGYGVTFGEAWRTDEQSVINALGAAGRARLAFLIEGVFPGLAAALRNNGVATGIARSLHMEKLAIDLNLFRSSSYLSTVADYEPLGLFWEALHPLARWGGRFGDADHFSLTWEGRK